MHVCKAVEQRPSHAKANLIVAVATVKKRCEAILSLPEMSGFDPGGCCLLCSTPDFCLLSRVDDQYHGPSENCWERHISQIALHCSALSITISRSQCVCVQRQAETDKLLHL